MDVSVCTTQGKRQKGQEADQQAPAVPSLQQGQDGHVEACTPALEVSAATEKTDKDRGGRKLSREERVRQRELAAEERLRKARQQAFKRCTIRLHYPVPCCSI
jgi:hypothetical protein